MNVAHEVLYTKSKGHATALARELVKEQVPAIAAVGGDGTVSEVAAGFFTEEGQLIQGKEKKNKDPYCTNGFSCDLARTLNLPSKLPFAFLYSRKDSHAISIWGLCNP